MQLSKKSTLATRIRQAGTGIALSALISSGQVIAQSSNANAAAFGTGAPQSIAELPPGLFRSQLENLPPSAQARALKWLQGISFPAADVAYLRADALGGVFYEDPAVDAAGTAESSSSFAVDGVTIDNVFTLHSRPGASRVVHVDFDGAIVTGTAWNSNSGFATLNMMPYDSDGNPASFNQAELNTIAEVWKRIAEDFAPFDIDVTTEPPAVYGPNTGWILVSNRFDADGNAIYNCSCGGVAYVGVWGQSNFTGYQPALVFTSGVGTGAHNIAEAASHELGHNLSLSHDATSSASYYGGHGSGVTSWAPIMGVGYSKNVTQWSRGEYPDANNTQDDVSLIGSRLGMRPDDHADTDFAAATALVRSGNEIYAAGATVDPEALDPSNKGVIEDRSDVDLFYFESSGGPVSLSITPAWMDSFSSQGNRGMNLDIEATLYRPDGSIVAQSNPESETDATLVASVGGGRHVIAVRGVGKGTFTDGYSDYGSLGQYYINGTVPSDIVYTGAPPMPTGLGAVADADDAILVEWTDPAVSPETAETGYRLYRSKDNAGYALIAELPADSTSYLDLNLANGSYRYQLDAFNPAGSSAIAGPTSEIVIDNPLVAHVDGERTATGSSSGSFASTTVLSGSQTLTEAVSGGKPSKRTSELDHSWYISDFAPGASVVLEMQASAPQNDDGDDFEVSYAINGDNAVTLGTIRAGSGYQNLSATLPAGSFGSLELRLTDTDRTSGNYSGDSVQVQYIAITSTGDPADMAPQLSITAPSDSTSVASGSSIAFSAEAVDYEDGDLGAAITWQSDLDGNIGNGSSFAIDNLRIGDHQITAEVSDSAGHTVSESVNVTITDPTATVELSLETLTPGEMAAGDNGVVLTLKGEGFVSGLSANFSGDSGPSPSVDAITVESATSVRLTVSAKSSRKAGNKVWDLTITNPDGSSATLPASLVVTN